MLRDFPASHKADPLPRVSTGSKRREGNRMHNVPYLGHSPHKPNSLGVINRASNVDHNSTWKNLEQQPVFTQNRDQELTLTLSKASPPPKASLSPKPPHQRKLPRVPHSLFPISFSPKPPQNEIGSMCHQELQLHENQDGVLHS